jgi:hypothetical protein
LIGEHGWLRGRLQGFKTCSAAFDRNIRMIHLALTTSLRVHDTMPSPLFLARAPTDADIDRCV